MSFGTYCITDQVMKAVELSSHKKQGLQLQIVDGWACKEQKGCTDQSDYVIQAYEPNQSVVHMHPRTWQGTNK